MGIMVDAGDVSRSEIVRAVREFDLGTITLTTPVAARL